MKTVLLINICVGLQLCTWGQEISPSTQQQLENVADVQQSDITDDSYIQQLHFYKRHPLDLNRADKNEMRQLLILSDLQIDNLIRYRLLLGNLIDKYELQAIPSWDISTIGRLLPYVTVGNSISTLDDLRTRFTKGDQTILIRSSEILERSVGFTKSMSGAKYFGDRQKLFVRYHYRDKNLLQWGITGDKDPGEQFFRGAQKSGFDFYSFHLFAENLGRVKALAIGDFTVNLGQGLIQWQGLAYAKSSSVMDIKRQSAVLRPYNSAGEFYFQRGVGATVQIGMISATAFISLRRISANFKTDTSGPGDFISSFQNSGYHRTQAEVDDKNDLKQTGYGANVSFNSGSAHFGLNGVAYQFSLPLYKKPVPYNLFAMSGASWHNLSFDYSATLHNCHLFGEEAFDKNGQTAWLNGLLISVDPAIDVSLLQRDIGKKYQAVYGDAFTENSSPTNENGIYVGIVARPRTGFELNCYADIYKFPWLKYLVDAPSYGRDFLVQIKYSCKQFEIYSRYRNDAREANELNDNATTNYLAIVPKKSWRTDLLFHSGQKLTFQERIEIMRYGATAGQIGNGFLAFIGLALKLPRRHLGVNARLAYFDTDGYDSRIYAYESDVLYSYSIPALFNKGLRYYLNANYEVSKKIAFWMRWSQTIYEGAKSSGSGLDLILGNHRSQIEAETRIAF